MASPQKEDGYTPIANEILEQLARVNLTSYQWRVLLVLLRKTYGWNKKEDAISLSQFVVSTGIKRPHICRSLKELSGKHIVTQLGNGYITKYMFQKDFDKWKSLPNRVKVVPDGVMGSPPLGNKPVPRGGHTKDIKDNIQKKGTIPNKDEVVLFFSNTLAAPQEAIPFWEYYEMVGWVVGPSRKPIRKWTMAAHRWVKNNKNGGIVGKPEPKPFPKDA